MHKKTFFAQNTVFSTSPRAQKTRPMATALHVRIWMFDVKGSFLHNFAKSKFQFFSNAHVKKVARASKISQIMSTYCDNMHAKYLKHSTKLVIAVAIFTFTLGIYFFPNKILFEQLGQLSELLCPT